ncbi:MAG TPA: hypothetical protein VKP30_02020, partial [Polyangiaceae bacterium]|nr:hypothetical protein [Polyangiaceae bacterium]
MLLFSRLGFSRAVRHIAGASHPAVCARHVAIGLMVAFGVVTGCGTDKSNSSSKQRTTSTTGGTSAVVSSQGGDRLESEQQAAAGSPASTQTGGQSSQTTQASNTGGALATSIGDVGVGSSGGGTPVATTTGQNV